MDTEIETRGQGSGASPDDLSLFSDPHRIVDDLRVLERSVRAEWPVPETIRPKLIERLMAIAAKSSVCVRVDDDGEMVTVEAPADTNAIRAIALLNLMTQQATNQRMEIAKMIRGGDKGTTVNVNQQTVIELRPPKVLGE